MRKIMAIDPAGVGGDSGYVVLNTETGDCIDHGVFENINDIIDIIQYNNCNTIIVEKYVNIISGNTKHKEKIDRTIQQLVELDGVDVIIKPSSIKATIPKDLHKSFNLRFNKTHHSDIESAYRLGMWYVLQDFELNKEITAKYIETQASL